MMNLHEERAWKLLRELGARETQIGGRRALDLSPIRVTSRKKLGLFCQALVEVVGRGGGNRRHTDRHGCPVYVVTGYLAGDIRSPNEGSKINRRPAAHARIYLASREVRRRVMGSCDEARFEAELRELVDDAYVTVGRVARSTRDGAIEAAHALAKRCGWHVSSKRIGWTTRDAAYERAIAEDAADLANER
jgi:hypothetical protein